MRALTIATALIGTAGIAAAALTAAPKGRTVWDGVYTEAQATAGAARYAQQCARCHGAELYGTTEVPSLRGQLIARYANTSLDALSIYINKAMPMQSPGALPPAMNAEILAYILKTNGAPAGQSTLPVELDGLKSIAVTAKPRSADTRTAM